MTYTTSKITPMPAAIASTRSVTTIGNTIKAIWSKSKSGMNAGGTKNKVGVPEITRPVMFSNSAWLLEMA